MLQMKKVKQKLAVLIVMTLTMALVWNDALFAMGSVSAAEDVSMGDTVTSGDDETTPIEDFSYTISSGEVTITGYKGSDTNIVIPKSINGYSVTSIGKGAFWDNSNLSNIEIPETVINIGESAFYGCSNLSIIKIPEGVTNIAEWTFAYCTNLSSIKFSNSLKEIGKCAFLHCSCLSNINFPEGLLSIGENCFNGCNGLTKVKLPQELTKLGSGAFYECRNLGDIELSSEITSIEAATFFGCSSLNNIAISEKVLSIDSNAFYGCTSLKDLYYEGSKEQWNSIAINTAAGLKDVEIHYGKRVAVLPVESTPAENFLYEVNDDEIIITDYIGKETDIIVPQSIDGINVTTIGAFAFANCTELESIKLPDSVVIMKSGAIQGCVNLRSIELSDGLTQIEDSMFIGCRSLENIKIPDSVISVAGFIFEECCSLTSIELPKGLKAVDFSALFLGCDNLQNIYFSEENVNYKSIDGVVFSKDGKIIYYYPQAKEQECYVIPENVTTIGEYAFLYCKNLTSIKISENIIKIENDAFPDMGWETFTDLYYLGTEEQWEAIEKGTYLGLDNVTIHYGTWNDSVSQGDAVSSGDAVYGDFTYQIRDNKVTITGYTGGDTEVIIPETVSGCDVTSIGTSAFGNIVVAVTIPKTVTAIENNAFSNLSQLTIYGYGGTYAETYANEKNVTFIDLGLVPATEITLSSSSVTLDVNETYVLQVTMTPADTTDMVTWSSSDAAVATVNGNGVVTAVSAGTTTITAKATSGIIASCTVTVRAAEKLPEENPKDEMPKEEAPKEIPATAIKLNKAKITLDKGKELSLKATITPKNSTDTIKWSSSNNKVAKVSDKGVITAVKKGTATITAKTTSGKTAICKVTVKEIKSTKIKLSRTKVTINKGKTVTLKATITPKNSTDTIAWSSNKKNVAKVTGSGNKAVVTAVKKGTATITAKTTSGKKVTCKITVKEIPATKIKLNKTSISLKRGKSVTLKATLTPKNSTDTVTWKSSNNKVAKVSDKGKVTAVKKGTATITAKTSSGKKVTCKITVK